MVNGDTTSGSAPGWFTWRAINSGYRSAVAMVARKRPKWSLALTSLPIGGVLGLLSVIGVQLQWIAVVLVLVLVSVSGAQNYGRAKGQEMLTEWWRESLDAGDPEKAVRRRGRS